MNILVVGAAGVMGRRVAAELAQSPDVTKVTLTARRHDSVARLASLFGNSKIHTDHLDVTDRGRFVELARAADVVVNTAGPYYAFEVEAVRASIEARANYVSLCDDHAVTSDVLALDGLARDAGVTIASGVGLSPGLTNLLVAVGAEELEHIDEIRISVAASSADTPGRATTLHFLAQMAAPAAAISDHTTEQARAGTAPKLVYFPDPVGWVETFRSGHPEVITMPLRYPNLRSLGYRVGLTERAAMDVIRASAMARLLATEKQRRLWLRMTEPLRPALEAAPPRGAAWTSARVDIRGTSEGKLTTVSLAVVDHLTNLAALPLARAAIEIGSGHSPHGVHVAEEVVDPVSFLARVSRRGIRIARLDPMTI